MSAEALAKAEATGGGAAVRVNAKAAARAKFLRKNMTEEERLLWHALRHKALNVRSRRQQAIGPYIVDFVAFEQRVIVEADGGQHAQSTRDAARDRFLEKEGFKILRFWNHEIRENMQGVLQIIAATLHPHLTSPLQGEE